MLNKKLIFLDHHFNTYQDIIQFVADKFSESVFISSDSIKEALMRRENLGTTFLGHFLALPHGYLDKIDDIHVLFIRLDSQMTVTYDNKQNKIKYIFAVLTSTKKAQTYLKVLSAVAQLVTTNSYVLDNAKNGNDLVETLDNKQVLVDEGLTAKNLIISRVTIDKSETISVAVDKMKKDNITFLPVTDNSGKLQGIIDLADIFAATFKTGDMSSNRMSIIHDLKSAGDLIFEPIQHFWENEHKHLVGEIMRSADTFLIDEDASYTDIVFLMTKYHHRNLIVIDSTKTVKGLIDTDDIVHKMIRV
jgi:PTS system nitrogen regulatory IIA component